MSPRVWTTELLSRSWLSERTFDCEFSRPEGFRFVPGQGIRFLADGTEREYSIASAEGAARLTIHVRLAPGGAFSPRLAEAAPGAKFTFGGPHGYLTFRASGRPAVFVATGAGIAPFLSMARSGVAGFRMFHGARTAEDLCHRGVLEAAALSYVPCISGTPPGRHVQGAFAGRVTDCLLARFPEGDCVFYLCGRREMIRDVTLLLDERSPGAMVFTEIFS
jgi:benzoate/toluate 1,2-dioxygenase reductase subunit